MILFFISSAILVVVVLALLLPVFFRNAESAEPNRTDINIDIAKAQARELSLRLERGELSEEDYADEKARLETDLARDIEKEERVSLNAKGQWLLWPVAAVLPMAAGAIYLTLGTPAALNPESYRAANTTAIAAPAQQPQQPPQAPDMQDIVGRIQQQIQEEPNDPEGYFMLGRALLAVGEYTQAEAALRQSIDLDGSNVDVQIRLADAIALTQDGRLTGEPIGILQAALEIQPNHPQGMWLYGMALNQNGEPAEAIAVWQQLLPQVASDPQATREVEQLIADANAQLPEAERVATNNVQGSSMAESAASGVTVTVDVDAGLADDLPANTPVFIYAKAANGPPMPLAVVRHALRDLPITVQLTDEQAMMESMKISGFDEVVIGARISKTGDPIAQTGDLFSESGTLQKQQLTDAVALTISGVVP